MTKLLARVQKKSNLDSRNSINEILLKDTQLSRKKRSQFEMEDQITKITVIFSVVAFGSAKSKQELANELKTFKSVPESALYTVQCNISKKEPPNYR